MNNMLDKSQLEAIEAREQSASDGPWAWCSDEFTIKGKHFILEPCCGCNGGGMSAEDCDFIMNARQDIPALLAHIKAQDERRVALERAMMEHCSALTICQFLCANGLRGTNGENWTGCGHFTKWQFDYERLAGGSV